MGAGVYRGLDASGKTVFIQMPVSEFLILHVSATSLGGQVELSGCLCTEPFLKLASLAWCVGP